MIKKTISLLLTVAVLLSLAACGKSSPTVMSYGGIEISEAVYGYHLSTYKALYISAYDDISDTDEFWLSFVGDTGKTGEEYVEELIFESVAQNLIAAAEFDKAGLTLTSDRISTVDRYIDTLVDEVAEGSRQQMNSLLGVFGINMNMLREVLIVEAKAQAYYDHLYSEGGADPVDDSERDLYYRENYVRFLQIFVNDVCVYEKDKDGNYKQDESGGYVTRDLTEEEARAAEEKINAVKTGLEAGEDFSALGEKYSDSNEYPGGFYFSADTASNYITPVVSAAFSLEEGQWTYVEGAESVGAFFVMRLPLDEQAYKNKDNSDFFEDMDEIVAENQFSALLRERMKDVWVDSEYMDRISVRTAEPNYFLY